jgi:hypothetical protein
MNTSIYNKTDEILKLLENKTEIVAKLFKAEPFFTSYKIKHQKVSEKNIVAIEDKKEFTVTV